MYKVRQKTVHLPLAPVFTLALHLFLLLSNMTGSPSRNLDENELSATTACVYAYTMQGIYTQPCTPCYTLP